MRESGWCRDGKAGDALLRLPLLFVRGLRHSMQLTIVRQVRDGEVQGVFGAEVPSARQQGIGPVYGVQEPSAERPPIQPGDE